MRRNAHADTPRVGARVDHDGAHRRLLQWWRNVHSTDRRQHRARPRASPPASPRRSRPRRPPRRRSRSARTTSTSRSSSARSTPRSSRTPATRSSASSASARARSASRRWTPARSTSSRSTSARASASTTRPRSPVTAQANTTALQTALDAASKSITVLGITPGRGHERVRGPRRTTRPARTSRRSATSPPIQDNLKWGLPSDCDTNPLCAGALKKLRDHLPAEAAPGARRVLTSPMATALQSKAIDVAEFCSTQPAIAQFGFTVLDDDMKTQPAENIAAARPQRLPRQGRQGRLRGAARRRVREDHDRGAHQAWASRSRSTRRTSRTSPRTA